MVVGLEIEKLPSRHPDQRITLTQISVSQALISQIGQFEGVVDLALSGNTNFFDLACFGMGGKKRREKRVWSCGE